MSSWMSSAYTGRAPDDTSTRRVPRVQKEALNAVPSSVSASRPHQIPLTALLVPVGSGAPAGDAAPTSSVMRSAYAFARFRGPAVHGALLYQMVLSEEATEDAIGDDSDEGRSKASNLRHVMEALKEIRADVLQPRRTYVALRSRELLPPAPVVKGNNDLRLNRVDALLVALRITMMVTVADAQRSAELFRVCLVHHHNCPADVQAAWLRQDFDPLTQVICWLELVAPRQTQPIASEAVLIPRALDAPRPEWVAQALRTIRGVGEGAATAQPTRGKGSPRRRETSPQPEHQSRLRQRSSSSRRKRPAWVGSRNANEDESLSDTSSGGDGAPTDVSSGPFSREINAVPNDMLRALRKAEEERLRRLHREQHEPQQEEEAQGPSKVYKPPWQLHTPPVPTKRPPCTMSTAASRNKSMPVANPHGAHEVIPSAVDNIPPPPPPPPDEPLETTPMRPGMDLYETNQAVVKALDAVQSDVKSAHGAVASWTTSTAAPPPSGVDLVLQRMQRAATSLAANVDSVQQETDELLDCVTMAEQAVAQRRDVKLQLLDFQDREGRALKRLVELQTALMNLHYLVYSFSPSNELQPPDMTVSTS